MLVQCDIVSHHRHVAMMHLHACRNRRNYFPPLLRKLLLLPQILISLDPLLDQNRGTQNLVLGDLVDYELDGIV